MRTRETTNRMGCIALVVIALWLQAACSRQAAPVAPEASPPPPASTGNTAPTPPPPPPPEPPPIVPTELSPEDEFASRSLEDINRESPLEPTFFVGVHADTIHEHGSDADSTRTFDVV